MAFGFLPGDLRPEVVGQSSEFCGRLELVELDLAALADVRGCADALLAEGQPFDMVIANAGVMACPKGLTADAFETQFGTNHLGHFVLVNPIAPLMREGAHWWSSPRPATATPT